MTDREKSNLTLEDLRVIEYNIETNYYKSLDSDVLENMILFTKNQIKPLRKKLLYMETAKRMKENDN